MGLESAAGNLKKKKNQTVIDIWDQQQDGCFVSFLGQVKETCQPPWMEMGLQRDLSGALFPSPASSQDSLM